MVHVKVTIHAMRLFLKTLPFTHELGLHSSTGHFITLLHLHTHTSQKELAACSFIPMITNALSYRSTILVTTRSGDPSGAILIHVPGRSKMLKTYNNIVSF